MSKINKIKLSGTTYDVEDANASKTVELTQAQYDALSVKDPNTFYIITDGETFDPSSKADTSAFTAHTGDSTIHVTSSEKSTWNAKSDFSGSYNDLTDKPTIPTVPTSNTAFTNDAQYATSGYVDSAVSGKANSSDVYTKSETSGATQISDALSGKLDTSAITSAVTSASTDSEIPTAKAVFDAIPQGGGGKAISAGTNISVTTGETADTINCTLPITATTNDNLIIGDRSNGVNDLNNSGKSIVFGRYSRVNAYDSLVGGYNCSNEKGQSQAFGNYTKTKNQIEFGCGKYNNSVTGSSTYGDSGNTLFSVGNGTADNARHNAFEIRQNGDIYITSGGTDILLQDHLGGGGGSITIDPTLDSGSTNAVANSAITNNTLSGGVETSNYFRSVRFFKNNGQVAFYKRFAAINGNSVMVDGTTESPNFQLVGTSAITTSITSGSTDSQVPSAKAVYDALGSAGGGIDSGTVQTMIDESISGKADTSSLATVATSGSYDDLTNKPTIPTVPTSNTAFTNDAGYLVANDITGKTDTSAFTAHTADTTIHVTTAQTAAWDAKQNALTIDSTVTSGSTNPVQGGAVYSQLGGLKLVKLTQTEYDNLGTKDSNTLYVITTS